MLFVDRYSPEYRFNPLDRGNSNQMLWQAYHHRRKEIEVFRFNPLDRGNSNQMWFANWSGLENGEYQMFQSPRSGKF